MVVRGLVEGISDNTHVKVRIPKINKSENAIGATPSSELATAIISTPPGYSPKIKRGDAVIVAFENDDESWYYEDNATELEPYCLTVDVLGNGDVDIRWL